mgnify:CR=1 FL=1
MLDDPDMPVEDEEPAVSGLKIYIPFRRLPMVRGSTLVGRPQPISKDRTPREYLRAHREKSLVKVGQDDAISMDREMTSTLEIGITINVPNTATA